MEGEESIAVSGVAQKREVRIAMPQHWPLAHRILTCHIRLGDLLVVAIVTIRIRRKDGLGSESKVFERAYVTPLP